MSTCILIGGGNTTNSLLPYETKRIDERIVKETKKEKPIFLFIGFASDRADSEYDHYKKIYQNLGCSTEHLKKKNAIHNRNIVEDKIERADIIYISGGDTLKLLETIQEYNIEPLLKNAYKKGTVLVGKSAGAILLSKEGFSDSYILRKEKDHYVFIKGLSFENISIVPHYKENEQREKDLEKEIGKKKVYGIQNGTALLIKDEKLEVIESIKGNHVYKVEEGKEEIL